jgi:hypothetical protein
LALIFDIGDPNRPLGHAIVYFRSGPQVLATYVLVLPIPMDMAKYLPPLLASQLGGMAGDMLGAGMGSFAAPPAPEEVEGVPFLEGLARLRGDDLVWGGDVMLGDIASAMHQAAEVVQEYNQLYEQHREAAQPEATEPAAIGAEGAVDVQRMLYDLLSERDRLGELSKLVGTLRFAQERGDETLVGESESSLEALERLLPEHYWAGKVRGAARDMSEKGAALAQLYVERCYKLLDEEYSSVQDLERKISELEG